MGDWQLRFLLLLLARGTVHGAELGQRQQQQRDLAADGRSLLALLLLGRNENTTSSSSSSESDPTGSVTEAETGTVAASADRDVAAVDMTESWLPRAMGVRSEGLRARPHADPPAAELDIRERARPNKESSKDRYISRLTGPLHFPPACIHDYYLVYHKTRECTFREYYKRCARLLIRLANGPLCSSGH
uniref:ALK and LTK ligand 2-like n=1 Tax=Petromyzon marinus TaxID=7757 RepID=A0AAJ7T0E7_PETMA|nr:ALK and LTK ligand 2-like [Petromyzon marinus]